MESYERFMDCLLDPAKCRLLIRLGEAERATARGAGGGVSAHFPGHPVPLSEPDAGGPYRDGGGGAPGARCHRAGVHPVPPLQADGSRLLREQGSRGLFLLYAQFSYRLMQEFSQYAKGRTPISSGTGRALPSVRYRRRRRS